MNQLHTITNMLKLANRINEIVNEMNARKQVMLAEIARKAA